MKPYSMSAYPRNSAPAAARIVALALISNGKIQPAELAVLEAVHANELLGLTGPAWHDVVNELCADLLQTATRGTECLIDVRLIERLLEDVDDVTLQRLVLRLCAAVAKADGQIEHGESVVLLTAFDRV